MNQNNIKPQELRATDLRVGNLVYYKNTNDIAKVELIHNKHFDCRDEYGSFTPNGDYEPIPLSEEVLLKCGFEKDKDSPWLLCNGMLVLNTGNHNTWEYGQSVIKDIKYLHTLQNVFFALHHRELEVSL